MSAISWCCEICGQHSDQVICDSCLSAVENNPIIQERIVRCQMAQDERDDRAVEGHIRQVFRPE